MNKEQTLESMEKAKRSLTFDMRTIESLLEGKDIASIPTVYKTNCSFGEWLYNEENNLKNLLGPIFFKELDAYHSQLHEEYRRIYIIFYGEPSGATKPKKNKVTPMELDKCKLYYSEMKLSFDKLLKSMASSKRRLEALAPEKFK